jgi:ABC-type amino acid transport substrate-binding protein
MRLSYRGAIDVIPVEMVASIRCNLFHLKGGNTKMKGRLRNVLVVSFSFAFVAGALASCGTSGVDNSKLIVGLECNYAPFNWTTYETSDETLPIDGKAGQYADGYDIQIAKLLGEKLGKEVVIKKTVWESLISDLQGGVINTIIAGMTDTEEREQSIDFTDEYYRSELVLVTTKALADQYSEPLTGEELTEFFSTADNNLVVSQVETVTDDIIGNVLVNYGARHDTPVSTFADAAIAIISGADIAMTAEFPVANAIVNSNPDELGIIHLDQAILGDEAADLGVSIGIKKGNIEFQEAINGALAEISQETRTQLMEEALARSSEE